MRSSLICIGGHAAAAALGLGAVVAAALWAADRTPPFPAHHLRPCPGRCMLLNTGCWVDLPWAYNDTDSDRRPVADYACLLSNMLNFVWCNEYAGANQPLFVTWGEVGALDRQLLSLSEALREPDVGSVLCLTAPGALANFVDHRNTLLLDQLLGRLSVDEPEVADDARAYRACLRESEGYRQARAQTSAADHAALGSSASVSALLSALLPPRTEPAQGTFDRLADLRSHIAQAACWHPCGSCRPSRSTFEQTARVQELLDACAARYGHRETDIPFRRLMPRERYWECVGGMTAWRAWANLMAGLCRAHGVKFIFYVPPHVHVRDDEYRNDFRPYFVEEVRRAFAGHANAVVIDHAADRSLGAADAVAYEHAGRLMKSGYLFTAVGRLKQARRLLAALVETEALVSASEAPPYRGSAWPGEVQLPPSRLSVHHFPEELRRQLQEEILQDEIVRRSRPAEPSVPAP